MTDLTPGSTLADIGDSSTSRRRRLGRRFGFGVLLLVVVLGLLGLLGPREGVRRAEGAGYSLEVTYGSIVRSGQPVPLEIVVDPPSAFSGPVELAMNPDLFDSFDFQNWYPNPSKETRTEGELSYEFDPPPDGPLVVHLDARVSPGLSFGPDSSWLAVVVSGEQVVRADFTTWVAP